RLAILDLSMPGLTGYELARAIRSIPGATHTRLVALSASRPVQDSQASADSGFEEHWVKPMGSELLKAMVARLLA
ncbi:MAG: response regulator, partial [Comamonadaceae bacterium]